VLVASSTCSDRGGLGHLCISLDGLSVALVLLQRCSAVDSNYSDWRMPPCPSQHVSVVPSDSRFDKTLFP